MRGGPYMQTPLVYGPHLYICSNAGILTCYDADTGRKLYKERIGGVSYTASPVAADGRIYFTSEQGQVRVVKAGPEFELLAVNEMDDLCMATPAISNGALFVRSQHFVWCLGKKLPVASPGELSEPSRYSNGITGESAPMSAPVPAERADDRARFRRREGRSGGSPC